MDIGKEVREVEFEPMQQPVLPSVPGGPVEEPVHSEPAPDKEPVHAAILR